ncbi:MAG: stage II sporulation protein M [Clostridia bacterium]|nr:stage II sporulation protein M [Clostridia bacterium]
MRNKRKFFKKKNKFLEIISEHISKNSKDYMIAILIFFIGIVIGVMLVNKSSEENKREITGYICNFIDSIKSKEYTIDGKKLFIKSLISNLKLAGIIWISGLTIVGIPIIYISIAYKGMCIGYSISAIIATLGKTKGIVFSTSTMLIQNVIAIPCYLALMVSAMKMYKSVTINRNKENLKAEICRHTIFSSFMTIGLIFATFLEYYFTTLIFGDIIINFV